MSEASSSSGFDQFAKELDMLVERYAQESDMTIAEIVGALAVKQHAILVRAHKHSEDDEEED